VPDLSKRTNFSFTGQVYFWFTEHLYHLVL